MKRKAGYDFFDDYNDVPMSKEVREFITKDNDYQSNFWRKVRRNESLAENIDNISTP